MHECTYSICYALLSVSTMLGLQVPKSTVCLSYLYIRRLSESCIFFSFYLFEQNDREGKLDPYHSLQTQQWAIVRFVSTFCSWCLIRETSSTLEKRFIQSLLFSVFGWGFLRANSLWFYWKAVRCDRRLMAFSTILTVSKSYCLWTSFLP